jgi:hypothetical protein
MRQESKLYESPLCSHALFAVDLDSPNAWRPGDLEQLFTMAMERNSFLMPPKVSSISRSTVPKFIPIIASGCPTHTGKNDKTVHVAWTTKGMGDAEYLAVWDHLLLPMAMEFEPGLVFISAGFDAAVVGDVGECQVTPEGFGALTRKLKS